MTMVGCCFLQPEGHVMVPKNIAFSTAAVDVIQSDSHSSDSTVPGARWQNPQLTSNYGSCILKQVSWGYFGVHQGDTLATGQGQSCSCLRAKMFDRVTQAIIYLQLP